MVAGDRSEATPKHSGLPPGPQSRAYFSTSEAHVCLPPHALSFLCNQVFCVCVCVAGGRFKKEIVVDGQSYLLLIRDEGGPPEAQVSTAPALGTRAPLAPP